MDALCGEQLVLSVETKHDEYESTWHCTIRAFVHPGIRPLCR